MAAISLNGIGKSFGATRVLDDLSLEVRDGEFLTLLGPSGCGKSTLLRVIAGLERADQGEVSLGGRAIGHLPPGERDVAMVFQSYALYPHMTVAQNLAMPLTMRRLTLAERMPLVRLLSPRRPRVMRAIMDQVREVAASLEIEALLDRRPAQLSGGQRQRVALGRAMVRNPSVFLMDEPLSNLDARLRVQVRGELTELHARLGTTFLYVTHDQTEAMTMSDRVALMQAGRILQLGTPADLYDRPNGLAVARFIGSPTINLLDGVADGVGRIDLGDAWVAAGAGLAAGTRVVVGVRAEALHVGRAGAAGAIPATLRRAENLGAEWLLHCDTGRAGGLIARLSATDPVTTSGLLAGSFGLLADPARLHLFDAGGARIDAPTMATEAVK